MKTKTARVAGSGAWPGVLPVLLAITILASGQVVENPAKPKTANAGRILQLTEVWKITDDGGEFFFRNPRDLQIAEDGSIFVADADQFLKFSPEGKFLKNIFRRGQGPGEMSGGGAFQYRIRGQKIFVLSGDSKRFWRADLEGRFQEKIDITNVNYPDFIGALPDGFLFLTFTMWSPNEMTGKFVEVPFIVSFVGRHGGKPLDILTIMRRSFLAPHAAMYDTLVIAPSPDGRALYIFKGWDYMIDVVDPSSGASIKKFRRPYPKVRFIWTEKQEEERRKMGGPRYEFEPDINNLYPTGDHLWVETSTNDKAKGRLYDVFDKDGRFLDSFYLGAGRTLMAVREDAVFCREKNEDETITIVKYRIDK
jgi:hypothetical protein